MLWKRKKTLFKETAEAVLVAKKIKRLNTRLAARRQITRLIRNFGERRIDEIRESHWLEYIEREQQARDRTFFDDKKYMRMVLLRAVRDGLIARRISLPIPDPPVISGRELSQNELNRLMRAARPELRFQIEIGYMLGLRLREMLKLRWNQFDWEKSSILFLREDTKTKRPREVTVGKRLMGKFRRRYARAMREFRRTRALAASQFVFPSPTHPGPQGSNKTAWKRAKRIAKVSAQWKDLRVTCSVRMQRGGITPKVTSEYLGNSELVLSRSYTPVGIRDLRAASSVMARRARKKKK